MLINVKLYDIYYLSSFPMVLPSSTKQVCQFLQEIRLVLQNWKFTNTLAAAMCSTFFKLFFLSLMYF